MNICVFSIVNYWQNIKGGMEIHGKCLSEGLAMRGHDVTVLSTKHPEGKIFEEINGIKLFYLRNTRFGSSRHHWAKESVKRFFDLHERNPFHVIWSQSFAAYGLAYSNRLNLTVPIIPILHGCIYQELNTFRANLFGSHLTPIALSKIFLGLFFSYYKQQRPLLSIADCIITASRELGNDLRRWYGEQIAKKAVPIFNGIDPEIFRPDPQSRHTIRTEFRIHDHEILLMTSGTLSREKGHHLAVRSLAHLQGEIPNSKLMIVGSGESRKFLEKQVRENGLGDRVLFTGFVPNYEMAKYYNAADIYLMPTLRIEGLPFVLLEAMSCGKPVVASRIGGNTSLVKHGENGFLIEPGDIKRLVHYLTMMLKDEGIIKRLSNSARETILENFTIDKMVCNTLDIMTKTRVSTN